MSSREQRIEGAGVDRRRFCAIGVKTAAAIVALPAASLVNTACGGSDESGTSSAGSSESPMPEPSKAAAPAPTPPKPTEAPAPAEPMEAPAPEPASGGEGQLVTEVAAVATLVNTLQYTNASEKPDQRCATCQLYTPQSGGRGKCQLFVQGLVKETGWCTSWIKKVA